MSFDYIVPENIIVFKDMDINYNSNFDKPSWFTTSKDNCTLLKQLKGEKNKIKKKNKSKEEMPDSLKYRFGIYNGNKFGYDNCNFDEKLFPPMSFMKYLVNPAELFSK
jgi:hypothetical protein